MAYTMIVTETQKTTTYNRCRVQIYAVGNTSGGGQAAVSVKDITLAEVDTATVTVPSQTSGSAEIYNKLLTVNKATNEAGAVVADISIGGDAQRFVEALGRASSTAGPAFGIVGMTKKNTLPGATVTAGEEAEFVICTGTPDQDDYELSIELDGQYRDLAVLSGSGVHGVLIPMSMCNHMVNYASVGGVDARLKKVGDFLLHHCTTTFKVPASVVPTIGDIAWDDANGYCKPGDGDIDSFAQLISDIRIWAPVAGAYSSTIKYIKVEYGGVKIERGDSNAGKTSPAVGAYTEADPAIIGQITTTGNLEAKITVKDSRKREATKTVSLLTSAYAYPAVTASSIERWNTASNKPDDESTNIRVKVAGSISGVNGKNLPGTIKVSYSEATEEPSWTLKSTTNIPSGYFDRSIDNAAFAETQAWRIKWTVTDYFGFEVSGEGTVYSARPIIDVAEDASSIGFWTTAGGREDVDGNPVDGIYLNGDLTLDEGMVVRATGGANEGFMDIDELFKPSFNYSSRKFQLDMLQNIALSNDRYLAGYNAAGALIRLLGVNANGNAELSWPQGGLSGRVGKQLWQGTASVGATITVPELAYYNVFVIYTGNSVPSLAVKTTFGAVNNIAIHSSVIDADANMKSIWPKSVFLTQLTATTLKVNHLEQIAIVNGATGSYGQETLKGIRGLL